MKKILITSGIPAECIEPFKNLVELTMPSKEGESYSQEELLALVPKYDALFCVGAKAGKELLDTGAKLKAVANFGVGYDNIDWKYATEKNIFVVNTPQAVLQPTAEFTVALILAISRGILLYDRKLRREKRCSSERFFNRDLLLYGKTLGLLGFGRIGKAVAQKCQGLGMSVIYYDPYRLPEEKEKELQATYMPREEVIANADVLSLHMPYTPENRHLINYDCITTMKPTAYLINAARGPIIKESDLVRALQEKRIRGAAIDVFDNEPDVSDELLALDNVVITPHVASCIFESRVGMAQEALSGLVSILQGKRPPNVANPQLFDKIRI
ncbi:MAG: NAD(P)-dependent oxidoreductase [Ethanoligenens sp.]